MSSSFAHDMRNIAQPTNRPPEDHHTSGLAQCFRCLGGGRTEVLRPGVDGGAQVPLPEAMGVLPVKHAGFRQERYPGQGVRWMSLQRHRHCQCPSFFHFQL